MLKLALIGYGKMGKMLEHYAPEQDCVVVSRIDLKEVADYQEITSESVKDADVCIDFSHPSCVVGNIERLVELKKNVVVGTTGWNDKLSHIKSIVSLNQTGMVIGANFSLGMNIFIRLIRNAIIEFDRFNEYDVYGLELHHRQKADSPSGTAIELTNLILENTTKKTTAQYDRLTRKIEADELHFASIRAGFIPGTHTIGFDSEADSIEITHRVRNRDGFAIGALKAAKWLNCKQGFYFFKDIIDLL